MLNLNQGFLINEYREHTPISSTNVTTGRPKGIIKLTHVNTQAPKFLKKKHGAGAPLKLFYKVKIRGQSISVYNLISSQNLYHTFTETTFNLDTLRHINISHPNFTFNNIFPLIISKDLFVLSYKSIKNNSSYKVIWATGTLEPPLFSSSILHLTVNQLNNQTYNFSRSFSDLVVQKVIEIIIQTIFTDNSLSLTRCIHPFIKTTQSSPSNKT